MNATHLADIAQRGNNSFNLIRLLAAASVIASHSVYIVHGEAVPEPFLLSTGHPLGAHAVNLFFALSGFMVVASWERRSGLADYALARVLRVYPALLVSCLAVFVLGGLATAASLTDYYSATSFLPYFITTIGMLSGSATLPGLFEQLPGAGEVNIPIWTLKYEVMCYIAMPIALVLSSRIAGLRPLTIVSSLAIFAGLALVAGADYDDAGVADHLARMGFAFFVGACAWHLRHKIPLSWLLLALIMAVAGLLTAFSIPMFRIAQVLALAYGGAMLASLNYGWLTRATDKTDLSYGIYVFGWPVQQTVLLTTLGTTVVSNAGVSLVIAAVCAFISWRLIKKPALSLRKLYTAPGVPA